MAVRVFDIALSAKKLMLRITLFCPLLGHELCGEELRRTLANVISLIHHEHVVRSPAVRTSRMRWRIWEVVIVVCRLATSSQETAERIRQPQCSKDVDGSFATMRVGFCIKQRNSGWQAVVAPYLHDVSDKLGLLVEILPRRFATIVGIVFKGHKGQVLQVSMGFQVVEKPAKP